MRLTFIFLVGLAACQALSVNLHAEPVQAGSATYEYSNTFTSRLFPGTPFNPGTTPIDVPVVSNGVFVTEWQNQVGTTMPFEIVSAVADGVLPTDPPAPFQILAGIQEVPQLGAFAGNYLNVVQDPGDPGFPTGDPSSLVSADVELGGPFAQVLIDGTTLYTTPYNFVGTISALPYPVGTEFFGTNDSEVRVQLGPTPDPDNDPVVGMALAGGIVRIDRVVPEPSAMGLLLTVVISAGAVRRRTVTR